MTKATIIFLLLAFFSCSNEKQVNVATFNIGNHLLPGEPNSWQTRFPLVKSFLIKQNFDVIGMQEVTNVKLQDLQKILPHYDYVGTGRDNGKDAGEYCPIFFKKNKYTLLAKSQFWLSETPDVPGSIDWSGSFPRMVTWIKLKSNSTGHIFFVFNTHFCEKSEDARKKSAVLLLKKIFEIAENAPVILTGDFSTTSDNGSYQILITNWNRFLSMINSEDIAKRYINKDSSTYNGFTDNLTGTKTDFIFVNGYMTVKNYEIHVVKEGNIFISDHYPVSVKLSFLFERRPRPGDITKLPWE